MGKLYRQLPSKKGPVAPQASQAPFLSYWKQPVNQPLRSRTPRRQQPSYPASEPFYGITAAVTTPSISSWGHPISQPYLRKGRRITISGGDIGSTSSAPYVSNWVHPVNQPLRSRTPKRQQPNYPAQEPFYGIVVSGTTPLVSMWKQQVIQPYRKAKRQQPPATAVPPTVGSQAPYLSNWVRPVNQPLKSRVPKRQQPTTRLAPILPIPSAAPYLTYWAHAVNQPLRNRILKRLQLPRSQPPTSPLPSAAPYISNWKRPTIQPLRTRPRRQQPGAIQTPYRPSFIVPTWKGAIEQLRRYRTKIQQPRSNFAPFIAPAPTTTPANNVSYWIHPVNQPIRVVQKRQQPRGAMQFFAILPPPTYIPGTGDVGGIWIPQADTSVVTAAGSADSSIVWVPNAPGAASYSGGTSDSASSWVPYS